MTAARILVVDDDHALLVALMRALRLRMPGVAVDTSDSAASALEKLAAADYDAVATDIKMPGMDGLTLMAEIRRRQPDLPVLLITGHGQHDLAVQGLRGGAFDFIQKPLDRDYFVASLTRAIRVRELGRQVEAQKRALEQHAARLEQAVKERTRELHEANEAKDEFLAMLAHELRNPLASIRSAVDFTRMCDPDDPARAEALDIAEKQIGHMTRLLDDLLDVSRIMRRRITLQTSHVDLASIVAEAVESVRAACRDCRRRFHLDLPDEPLPMRGDQTRLGQVIVNLLNNAVRYTDAGGRIWLKVERDGPEAVVEVRDDGIGIAPEVLPRIFEPFSQADRSLDRSRGGLGLGLTLVQKLVELHRGSIQADSEGEGRGSTFTVRLPLLQEALLEETAEPSLPAPVQRRRILVVDDNPTIVKMMTLLMQQCGHDVVAAAADGPSAIESTRAHVPEIVLLDIGLPGMNGYEVARRLREIPELKGVMLVALTGYGGDEDRRRANEAGFDAHLIKPVSVQALQELLARVGTAGRPSSRRKAALSGHRA